MWALLEMKERSLEEDDEMIHAAHGSLFHWLHAGTAVNHQRGVWLISRVFAVLGEPAQAKCYTERCVTLMEENSNEMQGFDWALAYEAMARTLALMGESQPAETWLARARQAGECIQDPNERDIFEGDLAPGPWLWPRHDISREALTPCTMALQNRSGDGSRHEHPEVEYSRATTCGV